MPRHVHGRVDHAGLGSVSRGMQDPKAGSAGQHKQAAHNQPTKEKEALHFLNIPLGGIYGKKNGRGYGVYTPRAPVCFARRV